MAFFHDGQKYNLFFGPTEVRSLQGVIDITWQHHYVESAAHYNSLADSIFCNISILKVLLFAITKELSADIFHSVMPELVAGKILEYLRNCVFSGHRAIKSDNSSRSILGIKNNRT